MKLDEACPTTEIDELPMMEADHVPEVYCDGAGSAEIIGDNVRITYFALRRIGGVKLRVPVLEMIRPLRSCGHGDMMRLVERALATEAKGAKPRH